MRRSVTAIAGVAVAVGCATGCAPTYKTYPTTYVTETPGPIGTVLPLTTPSSPSTAPTSVPSSLGTAASPSPTATDATPSTPTSAAVGRAAYSAPTVTASRFISCLASGRGFQLLATFTLDGGSSWLPGESALTSDGGSNYSFTERIATRKSVTISTLTLSNTAQIPARQETLSVPDQYVVHGSCPS